MVAVTTFVASQPRLRSALSFGARWGLGHTAAVLPVGVLVVAGGRLLPNSVAPWDEVAVGVAVVAVGIMMGVKAARRLRPVNTVAAGRMSGAVGALHGLAGAAPAIALIPVAGMSSVPGAMAYLTAFGVGTVAAMLVFVCLASLTAQRVARSLVPPRSLAICTAGISVGVGIWWIVAAILVAG